MLFSIKAILFPPEIVTGRNKKQAGTKNSLCTESKIRIMSRYKQLVTGIFHAFHLQLYKM